MLNFIAPLLALLGMVGLPADSGDSESSSFGVSGTESAYSGSTAKGSVEF